MNTEQLLEKMLENVREGLFASAGIQVKHHDGNWRDCQVRDLCECLLIQVDFRLKPRARNICGFEVPAPEVKEPSMGSEYYVLNPFTEDGINSESWSSHSADRNALLNGLWLSYDDAIANAKALRGEDPYK